MCMNCGVVGKFDIGAEQNSIIKEILTKHKGCVDVLSKDIRVGKIVELEAYINTLGCQHEWYTESLESKEGIKILRKYLYIGYSEAYLPNLATLVVYNIIHEIDVENNSEKAISKEIKDVAELRCMEKSAMEKIKKPKRDATEEEEKYTKPYEFKNSIIEDVFKGIQRISLEDKEVGYILGIGTIPYSESNLLDMVIGFSKYIMKSSMNDEFYFDLKTYKQIGVGETYIDHNIDYLSIKMKDSTTINKFKSATVILKIGTKGKRDDFHLGVDSLGFKESVAKKLYTTLWKVLSFCQQYNIKLGESDK